MQIQQPLVTVKIKVPELQLIQRYLLEQVLPIELHHQVTTK
jgi:hypothetical protein